MTIRKLAPYIAGAAALILAALACTSPQAGQVDQTASAAQATVIAGLTQVNIQPNDSEVTQGAGFLTGVAVTKQQATIAGAVAGTQTAQAGTPQPPPATITLAPPTPGAVSGKLCYPASVLPALTIYAKDVNTNAIFTQENAENQTLYTFGGLPGGSYYFFAYTHPGPNNPTAIGIGYTQAVLCGLSVSCTDHSMIVTQVKPGQTTTSVDICDAYEPSAIPPQP